MAYTPQRTIKELLEGILEAVQGVKVLSAVRGIIADLRVSIVNTPNIGTVTTITTVTTVSNQTSVGGYVASNVVQAQTNTAATVANINNLKIT